MEQYDKARLEELLDNINKIEKNDPHRHIDELISLTEEGLELCNMMERYSDVDYELSYFEYMKQCGSISQAIRLKMKRREDFEIVMRYRKIDDKQTIDIMTLNLSQSQIDGDVVNRLIISMEKNPNLTAKDAFNLIEPRLEELKSIIHEKLLLKNKPHLHLYKIQTLFEEAC